MATVPTINQSVNLQGIGPGRAQPGDFRSSLGSTIAESAGKLAGIYDASVQRKEQDQLKNIKSNFVLEAERRLNEIESASGADAVGISQRSDAELKTMYEEALGQIDSQRAQRQFNDWYVNFRTNRVLGSINVEEKKRLEYADQIDRADLDAAHQEQYTIATRGVFDDTEQYISRIRDKAKDMQIARGWTDQYTKEFADKEVIKSAKPIIETMVANNQFGQAEAYLQRLEDSKEVTSDLSASWITQQKQQIHDAGEPIRASAAASAIINDAQFFFGDDLELVRNQAISVLNKQAESNPELAQGTRAYNLRMNAINTKLAGIKNQQQVESENIAQDVLTRYFVRSKEDYVAAAANARNDAMQIPDRDIRQKVIAQINKEYSESPASKVAEAAKRIELNTFAARINTGEFNDANGFYDKAKAYGAFMRDVDIDSWSKTDLEKALSFIVGGPKDIVGYTDMKSVMKFANIKNSGDIDEPELLRRVNAVLTSQGLSEPTTEAKIAAIRLAINNEAVFLSQDGEPITLEEAIMTNQFTPKPTDTESPEQTRVPVAPLEFSWSRIVNPFSVPNPGE